MHLREESGWQPDLDALEEALESGATFVLITNPNNPTGNLFDRIRYGEVVDFLHFKLWGGYAWPDFNLADSFIVVGVGFLLLELLASEGEQRARTHGDEASS